MTKVKIGFDESVVSESENALPRYLELMSGIKAEYDSFGLRELKDNEIEDLIYRVDDFLKDILLENVGELKIGKLQLGKKKQYEFIEHNKHTHTLKKLSEELILFRNDTRTLPIKKTDFKIVEGRIKFPNALQTFKERTAIFIEDEEQIERYELVKQICDLLNVCKYESHFYKLLNNQRDIVKRGDKFALNIDSIKRR